jgi:YidC/Oxa1 family membrane protein insertase
MDNNKLIPTVGLFAVLFFLWTNWTAEQAAKAPQQTITAAADQNSNIPTLDNSGAVVDGSVSSQAVPNLSVDGNVSTASTTQNSGGIISVKTDVYDLEINLQGGTIQRVGLVDYPVSLEQKDSPYDLLKTNTPDTFQLQTGLLAANGGVAPNHLALFSAEQSSYEMTGGTLEIPLTWIEGGIEVKKTLVFKKGEYDFHVKQAVTNNSQTEWSGSYYGQFTRVPPPSSGGFGTVQSYTGGAYSTPEEPYEKISFGDMEDSNLNINNVGGWVSMLQHYFIGALVPGAEENNNFYSRNPAANTYTLGMSSRELKKVAMGQSAEFVNHVYVGPKIQDKLEALAPNLQRAVDYGYLWFIAEPLFKVLTFFHGLLGNWGWAIVFLTLSIKLLFYYPTAVAYRSMAKNKVLAPKQAEIRKRYADDKAKQQQEIMKLFKKEKVNPLGGCLPMLIQIPVFISLYWMLNETVELRQAPWLLWYRDLSQQDPYYILPILNGGLMFLQQKLNPPPADPMQQKIFQWMPVFFTFLFLFFPAGLVLYWVVNSTASILQQRFINKRIEAQAAAKNK